MNARKAIRTALKELLLGNTEAGDNVFSSRKSNISDEELPAITIFTPVENATPQSISQKTYIRTLEMHIEVRDQFVDLVDDTLDDLVSEIEQIMADNQSVSGTTIGSVLAQTITEIDYSGEKPSGLATMIYELKYIG
jgi:hypothetical protein